MSGQNNFPKDTYSKAATFLVCTMTSHLLPLKMCPVPHLNVWLQLVVTNHCYFVVVFFPACLGWNKTWCKTYFFLGENSARFCLDIPMVMSLSLCPNLE